jgi:hypothetical protein
MLAFIITDSLKDRSCERVSHGNFSIVEHHMFNINALE